KLYRKTRHTHHPVDDAKGNAEALLQFRKMGLRVSFQ
ncbi:MAG TPA: exonuclease, partial [Bacteroidia bacterium]|nr:exonuclease [Bacteroidia bacterium]